MTLNYNGINIYYTDEGEGNIVILLHGFLENSSMWNDLKPHIVKNNRVVCIDLLGHGKTDCLGYIHSMEDMANAVNAVLHHLKIKQIILIGHSLGGYVSLAFAEIFPDKVKGFCLMNSSANEDSSERIRLRNHAIKYAKTHYNNLVSMSIDNLFAPKNRILFSEEIVLAKNEALKTPLQGYIAAQEGMKIRPNREALLQVSSFKKMMIIGRKDPVLEYNMLIKQTKYTDTKIVEFSGGHMSHIENISELTYNILHYIENI